jgi:hypothetical protein
MSTLYLGHTFTTVEDCEDAWNELVDGDVTATADATLYCVGTKSCKLAVASNCGAGDILATEAIASLDASALTHVALWVRSTVALAAGDIQLLLDEDASCASPSESLNIPAVSANTWVRVAMEFAGATASRNALISVGLKMIVDKGAFDLYVDDIQAFAGADYDILYHRGIDDPDDVELNGAEVTKLIDGSYHAWDVPSENSKITVNFGVISSQTDRLFLKTCWKKSVMRLIVDGSEAIVVRGSADFGNTWVQDLSFAKNFTCSFIEKTARTTDAPSWS